MSLAPVVFEINIEITNVLIFDDIPHVIIVKPKESKNINDKKTPVCYMYQRISMLSLLNLVFSFSPFSSGMNTQSENCYNLFHIDM